MSKCTRATFFIIYNFFLSSYVYFRIAMLQTATHVPHELTTTAFITAENFYLMKLPEETNMIYIIVLVF